MLRSETMERKQKETCKSILITGGAGFIGSHLVKYLVRQHPDMQGACLDALTYAGNVANLGDVWEESSFHFVVGDVTDFKTIKEILSLYQVEGIIHLAAESHVDRSIVDPFLFARTNVMGTLTLLEAFREHLATTNRKGRFYQVSTDEVYGSLASEESPFVESTPYAPRSPYSAAKASADHFVRAYHETYGMDVVLSSCSNNFGPNQFPEKLLPLFIQNILHRRALPVYGKGENVRDWLYVENHVEAIEKVFFAGRSGETYNIGGHNEWRNIDLIHLLIEIVDEKLGRPKGASLSLISFVQDRLGHDLRYAIDPSKIRQELGWTPHYPFREALEDTVDWYLGHPEWLEDIFTGNYRKQNEAVRKKNNFIA